ncbi:QLQ domain-containing protein [Trichonephila clavipes]|nr:QLQ domain-containing protein [Trichonephila clavipes]
MDSPINGQTRINGQTVNQHNYIEVLKRLCEKIRKERTEFESDGWLLHQDNAPAHTGLFVKQFLANKNITIIENAPYSPNLAFEAAEKRTGRLKILGERSRRTLKRVVKQNRKSSLVEISQEFQISSGISVSSKTVHRELKNFGFHGHAAAHKPNITPQKAKHRLQWCRAHRYWTVDMWKTVLWSDESRFTVWQSDGHVWIWWMPGELFFSDCIGLTVKFGGGSIMGGGSRSLAWIR